MSALQAIWFLLIGVLLVGYAVLDGFDLGVGIWYLFAKGDKQRRTLLNAIGPVWDGNEVWLLTGGGAIFAAFPEVYATVFSGFYLALILVLLGLILRAVSLEFRSKVDSVGWRKAWDIGFAVGSMLPALLFGVAIGNVIRGLPLDADSNFAGTFFGLLNPFALLIGLTGFAMFATHGATYIVLKTEGELAERAKVWARKAAGVYLALVIIADAVTMYAFPHLLKNYDQRSWLYVLPVICLVAIVMTRVATVKGQALNAFAYSAVSIAGQMAMVGAGIFPDIVPALGDSSRSLTIVNASSSPLTLKVMLIVALLGMPLVLAYTAWIYYTFRGKVRLTEEGY
jgi:cytochrome d ubiquinol oxidase subunit II